MQHSKNHQRVPQEIPVLFVMQPVEMILSKSQKTENNSINLIKVRNET